MGKLIVTPVVFTPTRMDASSVPGRQQCYGQVRPLAQFRYCFVPLWRKCNTEGICSGKRQSRTWTWSWILRLLPSGWRVFYYLKIVRHRLDDTYTDTCIGRRKAVEWNNDRWIWAPWNFSSGVISNSSFSPRRFVSATITSNELPTLAPGLMATQSWKQTFAKISSTACRPALNSKASKSNGYCMLIFSWEVNFGPLFYERIWYKTHILHKIRNTSYLYGCNIQTEIYSSVCQSLIKLKILPQLFNVEKEDWMHNSHFPSLGNESA